MPRIKSQTRVGLNATPLTSQVPSLYPCLDEAVGFHPFTSSQTLHFETAGRIGRIPTSLDRYPHIPRCVMMPLATIQWGALAERKRTTGDSHPLGDRICTCIYPSVSKDLTQHWAGYLPFWAILADF